MHVCKLHVVQIQLQDIKGVASQALDINKVSGCTNDFKQKEPHEMHAWMMGP